MPTPIHWLETVDSTNEEGKRFLALPERLPLGNTQERLCRIIAAHQQTAGKGTQGRQWISDNTENLYCSWVHRGSEDAVIPINTDFTRVAAIAVASVLQERYHLPVFIKPINDLYAPLKHNPSQYGKLGGILVESIVQGGRAIGLITGLGLNRLPVNDPDGVLTVPPTSLAELLPQGTAVPEKEELITAITEALEPLYQRVFICQTLPIDVLLARLLIPTS